ncbi:MAG: GTPase [Pirellulaceae bacterium]
MTDAETTHVVLLTPAGRGAVASLLIEGPRACGALADCFAPVSGRAADALPIDRIVFGVWSAPPAAGEEVVVARRGPQRIEVHCHGGDAVSQAVLASLVERGCRRRVWAEAVASVDHHLADSSASDRLVVEARLALAEAATETVAAILLDQWRGALRREVDSLRRLLVENETSVAAVADRLDVLLQAGRLGVRLTQPFRVVLAGRPNVGKSSLVNALLGYARAIVFDQPGTTRDVVTAHTAIEGWPVELSDTAGLRAGAEAVESLGIERARRRIAEADLVVAVLDASQPLVDDDRALLTEVDDALIVYNKCDLGACFADEYRPEGRRISALTGEGVEHLLQDIARRLVPAPPTAGHGVPFTARQIELLRDARDALLQENREQVQQLLGQL